MKERLRKKRFGIVMMLPAFFAIVLLKMYPIVQGIWYAFTNRRMDRPESFVKFVGLKNIIDVFQDKNVQSTVLFTFEYAIGIVAVSYVIGLMLALLLNRDIKGRGFYRALVLLPWVVSNTVAAANFRWILNEPLWIYQYHSAEAWADRKADSILGEYDECETDGYRARDLEDGSLYVHCNSCGAAGCSEGSI